MRQIEPQLTLGLTTEGAAPFHQLEVHIKAPQPPALTSPLDAHDRPAAPALSSSRCFATGRFPFLLLLLLLLLARRCAAASRRAVMFARRVRTGQARTGGS
jgi:hypothetical protein